MKTTVSTKGQIILPAEIRQQDSIEPGQEFEVERIDRGEYRLKRKERRRNEGLMKLLLACPVKGWFRPIDRKETCLPWDATISRRWAKLVVDLKRKGDTLPLLDSMIAATALEHDLTLATRNTRDFKRASVKVLDPFA